MKAEGTIAHGGGSTKESHGVKRAVVDPVQSESNGDKYQNSRNMSKGCSKNQLVIAKPMAVGVNQRHVSSMMVTGLGA